MSTTVLNKLIEDFSQLPMDDKEYAVDIIKKQLTEARRDAIAKRAKEAMANLKKRAIRKGTVRDLYKDLEID
jgi:ribosomal protein S1